jgi:DNA polymerase II large subunit
MDIREDIIKTFHQCFGTGFNPYVNDYRITVSNRVLYYFFKDILKLSNSARTKRVPTWINKLPLKKISNLLSAYFSGDGGVDKHRLNVTCTSYSRNLIRDLDLLFLRYGIFANISESKREDAIEYKLRLVGENAILYSKNVGFCSKRKASELAKILQEIETRERHIWNDHRILSIKSIKNYPTKSEWVYTLNADKYHTVLVNEHIMTHQCDGDEDGIMLILEYLLNFSMYYLPASLGGKMDAPLVLSIRLDPMEVDGESHNVDYAAKYPLQFYLDTVKYAKPGDAEKYMKVYKNVLKKEGQYEGCMFTHPTQCIHLGPKKSAYTLFETMAEKIESQLWLSKTILAVDAQDVARKIISSHFAPDCLGNIRSFSTQGFRCPKCGAKYRRVPLSGVCMDCGGTLLMTVSKGGITKYLDKAIKMIKEFDLGPYTAQRWDLISKYVESLTNNPRIKQKSISAFFK